MSVKIKVSYEQEQELEAVKVLLAPMLRNVKVSRDEQRANKEKKHIEAREFYKRSPRKPV